MYIHGEYVQGRGTVVYETGNVVVFSRLDSFKRRVFDVVDFNVHTYGHHITTSHDVKEAKLYARNVTEEYLPND